MRICQAIATDSVDSLYDAFQRNSSWKEYSNRRELFKKFAQVNWHSESLTLRALRDSNMSRNNFLLLFVQIF